MGWWGWGRAGEGAAAGGGPGGKPGGELVDRAVGRPVAEEVNVWREAESVALICKVLAVPTVHVMLPGLGTVMVLPALPVTINFAEHNRSGTVDQAAGPASDPFASASAPDPHGEHGGTPAARAALRP